MKLHDDYPRNTAESFKYLILHTIYCEKKMENTNINQIKRIVKNKIKEAKEECYALVNPLQLPYDQLSYSEKVLSDFCYYLDNYDSSVLERLVEIINKMFYG